MPNLQNSLMRLRDSSPFLRSPNRTIVTTVIPEFRPNEYRQARPRSSKIFVLPNEPEDARLTGGTRSLDRRLLALNLCKVDGDIRKVG
jgi:hypothetical protein